ncbi:molybdopterin molybdotransferase MoeA [Streptomyces sp. NBC_00006]|uniref:molybdopterin molybdotransferase MoeA n=1 Tax=unclassified Streptomyces TaxID=2593676 RepID=UPI002251DA0B|nr:MULTISPECIES: molybdopterin molybdotransferase MoeA [unclassified Streptomyces]MCX5532581.1 molybdopterin molybdotransferase MoeA [Streptomyces sp. NBC_00006]
MSAPNGRSPQAVPVGVDPMDVDVDEALALANDNRPHGGRHHGEQRHGEPHQDDRRRDEQPKGERTTERTTPQNSATPGTPVPAPSHRHAATSWATARRTAARAERGPRGARSVPLDQALGLVLAAPLTALTDLPSFDTSAMDGWVVAGPGPWAVGGEGLLAGHEPPAPLTDGEAAAIATGARVPSDATAVIRSEHGHLDAGGQLHALHAVAHGQDIRPRGQECRSGELLLPAGALVTPAVLGLAAAAGYDTLTVVPRPTVEVLILGDELLTAGLPRDGLIRDALGPMLPHWLRALGVEVIAVRRLGDDAKALLKAVREAGTDLVVTTGGTASGPVDHVHPTLRALDAELLVDGVAVRPGHPMLLARLKEGQHLVGLPGNPLAAVSGLLTLAEPLLRVLSGRAQDQTHSSAQRQSHGGQRQLDGGRTADAYTAPLHTPAPGHPHDTRLIPIVLRQDDGSGHEWAVPLHYNGPAMLRGIAAADGLAVIPPGGATEGQEVEILDLPWSWNPGLPGLNPAGNEGCFT